MKLTVKNISNTVLTITDPTILLYATSSYFRPGDVIDLPAELRNSSQELNSWRDSGLVTATLVDGDAGQPSIGDANQLLANEVVVIPNDNPLIQEPNVQRFLDEVEEKLSQGGGGGGTRMRVEEFTLDPTDISNKYVTLQYPPLNNNISLSIANGPQQSYTEDYIVSGQNLTWSGRGMDGVLSTGDELVVEYERTP